jgi:hypothetical protein
VIKGEVLEEGVESIRTADYEVNTTIPCKSPYDCSCSELLKKYNADVGGGCVCIYDLCQVIIDKEVPKSNTYSVKVLKVYSGNLKEGQEIVVNNYEYYVDPAVKRLDVGSEYKLVLKNKYSTEEKADADTWLFDSQKERLKNYLTGKFAFQSYIPEISQPEAGMGGFIIIIMVGLVILAFIFAMILVKGNILIKLITSLFIIVFVIPATLLTLQPLDGLGIAFMELLFLIFISLVFMIFKINELSPGQSPGVSRRLTSVIYCLLRKRNI